MHFSIDRTVHTTAFDKPVVDHWLERKIALLKMYYKGYSTSTTVIMLHSYISLHDTQLYHWLKYACTYKLADQTEAHQAVVTQSV